MHGRMWVPLSHTLRCCHDNIDCIRLQLATVEVRKRLYHVLCLQFRSPARIVGSVLFRSKSRSSFSSGLFELLYTEVSLIGLDVVSIEIELASMLVVSGCSVSWGSRLLQT